MAAAANFNGGRSQTGLNNLQTGGEYPFLNVVKTCQNWSDGSGGPNNNGLMDPSTYDADGYPTSSAYNSVCYVPPSWVGQSLTVQWDGGGTILVPGNSAVGSTTSSDGTTNNSITCTCVSARLVVGVTATSAAPNHIKNLRVSLTGDETTRLNNGEVFRPQFLNKLIEGGFGVLRFMDWQDSNTTNMVTWAHRKPLSHWSYYASEYRNTAASGRPALYCGATTSSTNAYSITGNGDGVPSSGSPAHMQVMQLHFNRNSFSTVSAAVSSGANTVLTIGTTSSDAQFSNGQTVIVDGITGSWSGLNGTYTSSGVSGSSLTVAFDSSALTPGALAGTVRIYHDATTLSLNGTSAKPIYGFNSEPTSIGGNTYPVAKYGTQDAYGTAIYDSELNSGSGAWILYGGNIAQGNAGIISGAPYELSLQLAAEVGAQPWFCGTRFGLDSGSDHMPSLAAYCRDNAPSWMIPRFETPNEIFNTGNGGFHNGTYAQAKAFVKWGSLDKFKSQGYWMSILGQGVAAAYGVSQADVKTQTRYQAVCGVQTIVGSPEDQLMTSAAYISGSPAAPAGYSKAVGTAEAWRWTNAIAVAQYWTPADYTSPEETAAVAAYQAADARVKADLLDNYIASSERTNGSGSSFTLTNAISKYSMYKTWALSFSVTKMCGYEGCFSPDYTGGGTSNADLFRNDCKARELTASYLQSIFTQFVNLSDSTFTCEFPSTFFMCDFTYDTTTSSIWSLLKGDIESPNTPVFEFIIRFNKGRRAINLRSRIHG